MRCMEDRLNAPVDHNKELKDKTGLIVINRINRLLVNLEPLVTPVLYGNIGLKPINFTAEVMIKLKEYPKVVTVVNSFESMLVEKQNGFTSPECPICDEYCKAKK